MGKDALIESAMSHWAPRMVSNGVMLTDFQEVTASVERWDDWCGAWCKRAAVHEDLGLQALQDSYMLTAAEHLSRAAVYYHFAKFVYVHDIDQMRAAHMKAVECKNLALPHLSPPIRRVQIPYRGKHLVGFLRLPAGAVRPPVMIMVPGLDSAK
ncbi:MAG: alpha/beta hydrolase, partial [Betaproteobacteria bacterium]